MEIKLYPMTGFYDPKTESFVDLSGGLPCGGKSYLGLGFLHHSKAVSPHGELGLYCYWEQDYSTIEKAAKQLDIEIKGLDSNKKMKLIIEFVTASAPGFKFQGYYHGGDKIEYDLPKYQTIGRYIEIEFPQSSDGSYSILISGTSATSDTGGYSIFGIVAKEIS